MAMHTSRRVMAWRTLHGVLPRGALQPLAALRQPDRVDTRSLIAQAMCPHCSPLGVPKILTHMKSPVAIAVWD